MKLISDITVTEIGDEFVAVPVGKAAEKLNGIIKLNKTAKDIWDGLQEGLDENEIVKRITDKYSGVDESEALLYVREMIERLFQAGLMIE